MLREIFEQVDELTGDNPTWQEGYEDNVKSAVHAIITKSMDIDARELKYLNTGCGIFEPQSVLKVGSSEIMKKAHAVARSYKEWKLAKPDLPHYLDW